MKLRNPWGLNKGNNPKNGYDYDWKRKLTELYGSEKYDEIIEDLKRRYDIDLFAPQINGIFYMHYNEFMTYFESITVCPVYSNLNLLTYRSVFLKNKPKFFYFDLTKPGSLIISMSQMFKKLEKEYK